jgi:hypothetical protein
MMVVHLIIKIKILYNFNYSKLFPNLSIGAVKIPILMRIKVIGSKFIN